MRDQRCGFNEYAPWETGDVSSGRTSLCFVCCSARRGCARFPEASNIALQCFLRLAGRHARVTLITGRRKTDIAQGIDGPIPRPRTRNFPLRTAHTYEVCSWKVHDGIQSSDL